MLLGLFPAFHAMLAVLCNNSLIVKFCVVGDVMFSGSKCHFNLCLCSVYIPFCDRSCS
jgi:hypothetical protein